MTHYLHREHVYPPAGEPYVDTSDPTHYTIEPITEANVSSLTSDPLAVGWYWVQSWDRSTPGKVLSPNGMENDYAAVPEPDEHT